MSLYPLQAQNFSLSGAGCSIGDTVLNLKSFKDILGVSIAMADLGSIAYLTIEPGNGTQEEQVSFTGVTQNADGSAQLTGIKTVLFKTPYTETSGIRVTHPGSVVAILTNTAAFYNKFGILSDDSVITGNWTAPDPSGLQSLATKNYVLNTVSSGGSLKVDSVIVAGTAGETVSAGQVLYLKSDGSWWKATSVTASTYLNVELGIAQGSGTAGNPIASGVLIHGVDTNQSGLSTGTTYYVSTAGSISSSSSGRGVGVAKTSTSIYFDPFTKSTALQYPVQQQAYTYAPDTSGTGNTITVSLSPIPTTYTSGMVVVFKAANSVTGSTTLNVNGLGATTIKNVDGSNIRTGDIVSGQIVATAYDGTNFQNIGAIKTVFGNGIFSKDLSLTSDTVIAHGLGKTPKKVKLTVFSNNGSTTADICIGTYDGTTMYSQTTNNGTNSQGVGVIATVFTNTAGSVYSTVTVAWDSTNLTFSFAKTGSPTGTSQFFWEAEA